MVHAPVRFNLLWSSLAAMCALAVLAGCSSTGAVSSVSSQRQPRAATYACQNGGTLMVANAGTMVTVTAPGASAVTLPASPPGQRNRYSADLYTLVLDGRNAFWHKTGDVPRDCSR